MVHLSVACWQLATWSCGSGLSAWRQFQGRIGDCVAWILVWGAQRHLDPWTVLWDQQTTHNSWLTFNLVMCYFLVVVFCICDIYCMFVFLPLWFFLRFHFLLLSLITWFEALRAEERVTSVWLLKDPWNRLYVMILGYTNTIWFIGGLNYLLPFVKMFTYLHTKLYGFYHCSCSRLKSFQKKKMHMLFIYCPIILHSKAERVTQLQYLTQAFHSLYCSSDEH